MTPDSTAATEAFTAIYGEHRQAVHAYLLGRIAEAESARDLLQETFLRVWRNLSEVRELTPQRQRGWIFAVARNLTIDSYRSQATRAATDAALRRDAPRQGALADQPDARAELSEQLTQVEKAIRQLPEQLRTVLTMSSVGELNSAQIAEALGEPPGTIRYRLSVARKRLAEEVR